MLDRTISGAGALADLADRAMRVFGQRPRGNPLATRPGSVLVVIMLLVLAALLVLAGLEVTDDPTPRQLAAADVAADQELGNRVHATVEGSVSPDYVETFFDVNGNEVKDADEITAEWFYFLVDPDSHAGVTVRSMRPAEQIVPNEFDFNPATFTGMLRRDERAVSEAITTSGLGFEDLGLEVSARYLLDDGATPANPFLAFGLAAAIAVLAGAILVGLAGGYLIYRRSDRRLPEPATSMALGERVPLKVTGLLRTTEGLVHVREVSADLVRFSTAAPAAEGQPAGGPTGAEPAGAEPEVTEPSTADAPTADRPSPEAAVAEPASTLIIKRRGRPEGVALGLGQLVRLTSGVVLPFRGQRPALRAVAGTGPLLLSFDDERERDRAAAELLDETGLGSGPDASDWKEG